MSPYSTESQQREKIITEFFDDATEGCNKLAREISDLIKERATAGRTVVLGLATGSTPVRLYRELIRLHREEGLSFRHVVTFNLDEYYGLPRTHPESYWRFMHEQLFNHIDLAPENIHLPDGMVARSEAFAGCKRYEAAIRQAGGIDIQVLGIGRTGHIGFNEPGSARDSRTRLVTLDSVTRRDAARDFLGEINVPRYAITMGIGTILEARRIVLLAWGEAKAGVVARAVEGPVSDVIPASFLQGHPNVCVYADRAAAAVLTREQHPWLVGPVEWTPTLTRRAVVWLAQTIRKPILKLLDEDYTEHGMAELLTEQGPAYGLNIRIFNQLQYTISGWPGGKPNTDDTHRPVRATPFPKRIVVLSPEPGHDVLGMGGTLRRLAEQGHTIVVVYLTSGNLAVSDDDATTATDLVLDLAESLKVPTGQELSFARAVHDQLRSKAPADFDTPAIRQLKGLLRRGEARAAAKACGLNVAELRFLDLPFYERGRYRQFALETRDVDVLVELLKAREPDQLYLTGRHDDPSSVAGVCFQLVKRACARVSESAWFAGCQQWLYRSGGGWSAAEVGMAVPFSPRELAQKIQAIYHHKSQRSQIPVASGLHEAWQQAEQQNRSLAETYDQLGFAQYEAIEAFESNYASLGSALLTQNR